MSNLYRGRRSQSKRKGSGNLTLRFRIQINLILLILLTSVRFLFKQTRRIKILTNKKKNKMKQDTTGATGAQTLIMQLSINILFPQKVSRD